MGWHHQMPTSVLVNLNLSIEKLIFSPAKTLEVMIGGDAYAGTLYNGLTFQSTIRLGKMLPYFSGYTNRFTSARRLQAYFMIKPQTSIVIHNTLLDGSLFHDYPEPTKRGKDYICIQIQSTGSGNRLWTRLSYGPVGFSFILNTNTGLVKDQPTKSMGNVSFYFAL